MLISRVENRVKRSFALCLLLALCASWVPIVGRQAAQSDEAIQSFWKKFKSAVISGNKQVAAGLSSFPIGMSYGISRIRSKAEFLRRYGQIFSEQSDAAKCFGNKQPEIDSAKPTRATVACPNEAGDEVVIYHFQLTRRGWRFIALDNINE
jgi:hypothetical protein